MSEKLKHGVESQKEQEPSMRLEEFERLFEKKPRRIEEMKKVFSLSLHCALASDFEGRRVRQFRRFESYRDHPEDHLMIRAFEEVVEPPLSFRPERKTWKTDRETILGAEAKERALAEIAFKVQTPPDAASIWIGFVFSTDKETAKRYWNQGQMHGRFAAPHELTFHGMFIDQPYAVQRQPFSLANEHPKFSSLAIDRALVKNLLEWIDVSTEKCTEAVAEIERLGKELGFDAEKIKKLQQATRDFATYVKPKPITNKQCFREVGRCFTVPYIFRDFARDWHKLKEVDDDFYEHSYAGHATFFHGVNVVNDKMVIDWTARQYRQFNNEPYPFVYRVGDERLKSFGPLRLLEIKEKRIKISLSQ